jgi:hypothetical protein
VVVQLSTGTGTSLQCRHPSVRLSSAIQRTRSAALRGPHLQEAWVP